MSSFLNMFFIIAGYELIQVRFKLDGGVAKPATVAPYK